MKMFNPVEEVCFGVSWMIIAIPIAWLFGMGHLLYWFFMWAGFLIFSHGMVRCKGDKVQDEKDKSIV